MKKIITLIIAPFLLPLLIAHSVGCNKDYCVADLKNTLRYRANPFKSADLQFLYFMVWLPEYRSVFYRRYRLLGMLYRLILPPQKCLYIRMCSNQIGGGLCVNHGHSTELNAKKIGKNCIIFQNVTIGTNGSSKGPTIGDNCFFEAGCVVIGDISIGDNVKIGANAIVTKSIPDNCTVVTTGTMIVKQNGIKVNIKL